jgi:hypothetical protein
MSAINKSQPFEPAFEPLALRELAELLVKHYDVHEGLFDTLVEFQIGVGPVGPTPDSQCPGAMVGVSKVGLVRSTKAGPATVDASIVNPAKKKRKNPS